MKVMKRRKAFTFVELVAVILIIMILAGVGSWLLIFFIENFYNIPNKLTINTALADVSEIICEGDDKAGGLRFSQGVSQNQANQLVFIDQAGHTVIIKVNNSSGNVTRSIDASAEQVIPYYAKPPLSIVAKEGEAFKYYDKYGNITAEPSSARRVEVRLIADMTGSPTGFNLTTPQETSVSLRR